MLHSIKKCTLLLNFLNSRPTEQKTFMNRILVLTTFNNHLLGTRHFILSLAAFFFNSKLKLLVVTYPLAAAAFLSERCYLIIGTALLCSLSGGEITPVCKTICVLQYSSYSWFCSCLCRSIQYYCIRVL